MNAESGAGGVRDQLEQPSCWSNATMGIEVESTGNRAMTSHTRDFGYILSGHKNDQKQMDNQSPKRELCFWQAVVTLSLKKIVIAWEGEALCFTATTQETDMEKWMVRIVRC